MRSLSILLCGYGWFAGIPEGETNNAELIARALDGETLIHKDICAEIHGMTMPFSGTVLLNLFKKRLTNCIRISSSPWVRMDAPVPCVRSRLASTGARGVTRRQTRGLFPDS